jgi:5'-3' exonuclease
LWWSCVLEIYLIDGTYELFRHYYALPSVQDVTGREVAAVRGVLASVLGMIKGGATHIAVATDHVIESFRNELWPGYKTSEGDVNELRWVGPTVAFDVLAARLDGAATKRPRPAVRRMPKSADSQT